MALYDFVCNECGKVEECYGARASEIERTCECGNAMVWRPYINTQSTKAGFSCSYSGREFGSYGDLERWAKSHNKTVVSTKEFERDHVTHSGKPEDRHSVTPGVREELKKNLYRQRHRLPKE